MRNRAKTDQVSLLSLCFYYSIQQQLVFILLILMAILCRLDCIVDFLSLIFIFSLSFF